MITCPSCGSNSITRYKDPKEVSGWLIRRKRCLACRHIFMTGEVVLAGKTAMAFETLMPSSEQTPDDSATSGEEVEGSSPTTATWA